MLVLASASPRRRELLERVGLRIEVRAADVDENPLAGEEPGAYVQRLAHDKARAVSRAADEWVLAADTTVTIDGLILGKAETPEEAERMLRLLSGRSHYVMTGFAILGPDERVHEGRAVTSVRMRTLDDDTLADYVACGEWRGKAGAYAIQGIAAALVLEVEGSVTNVIGLPLAEVLAGLREVGGPQPQFAAGVPA
jgi:septum formation protein